MVTGLPLSVTSACAGGLGIGFSICAERSAGAFISGFEAGSPWAAACFAWTNMVAEPASSNVASDGAAMAERRESFMAHHATLDERASAPRRPIHQAPVAQLDRATASEAVGQTFESSRAHHFLSSFSRILFRAEEAAKRSLSSAVVTSVQLCCAAEAALSPAIQCCLSNKW